jgi:uncharacterized protein YgiM (DUF1202 family)
MKGFLLGIVKLILGVSLAMVLLSLTGVATARYFMAKLSVLPPKPVFNNDDLGQPPTPTAASAPQPTTTIAPVAAPPGSYEAIVVQPIGLVLRAGAGTEFEQLGGIDYNELILVLKTSDDGNWLNVRVKRSGQEGWVKAGNIQNLTTPTTPPPQ